MKVEIEIDRYGNVIVTKKPRGVTLQIDKEVSYGKYKTYKSHHMQIIEHKRCW